MDGMSIGLPSLVIHECCGLSVFCLKSWIALLVVVPIDNKCLFHKMLHYNGLYGCTLLCTMQKKIINLITYLSVGQGCNLLGN